jgi:glycosyltransferase involved in cell wall biosynthesis
VKISIVTISFNQAQYLRECIESVLNQDYPDIEYIVVDPGSTDGSREIIEAYGDRIIRIFESDNGPADGLNMGFRQATGKVYGYLNSDDTLLPGAFSAVSNYFHEHTNVDVICGHAHVIDSGSEIKREVYSDKFTFRSAAYGAAIAIQPSTYFRQEIFWKVGGFNVNNRSNWDGELLIDMALAGARVDVVNEFLSCYRVYGESITGSGRLTDAHALYGRMMFEKIKGRPFRTSDLWWAHLYRLRKHLLSPRAALERLRHGPVFHARK